MSLETDTESTTAETTGTPNLNGQSPNGPPASPTASQGIPDFEGEAVWSTSAKMVGGSIETDESVYKMDHYVQLLVTTRVLGVDHVLNEKTGKLTRVHKLKVVEGDVVKSWDPLTGNEDPT